MINIREFFGLGYYTSTLDKFLAKFRQIHQKKSPSQQKEIEKYARIYALRDNALNHAAKFTESSKKIWSKF